MRVELTDRLDRILFYLSTPSSNFLSKFVPVFRNILRTTLFSKTATGLRSLANASAPTRNDSKWNRPATRKRINHKRLCSWNASE